MNLNIDTTSMTHESPGPASDRAAIDPRSPLPRILTPVGGLFSQAYGAAIRARNRRYDRRPGLRLNVPVISVGNIRVGGTGKTPFVAWTCDRLREAGHRPIVGMRGYKARSGERSDEESELLDRLDGIPVVANPERGPALRAFLDAHDDHDCVVLDDGFQHRQVQRDLDIVLIDATRPPADDRLLPAGWLREPVQSLARADMVVLTRADLRDEDRVDRLRLFVHRHHGQAPVAMMKHAWSALRSNEGALLPTTWLARRRVLVMCGIGHPRHFIDMAELRGSIVLESIVRRDHADYGPAGIQAALDTAQRLGAEAILITGKDWVKIAPSLKQPRSSRETIPFVRPELCMESIVGEGPLTSRILETVRHTERGVE